MWGGLLIAWEKEIGVLAAFPLRTFRRKWITPSLQDADSKHAIGVDMDLRYLTENELTEDALHNFGHDGLEAV